MKHTENEGHHRIEYSCKCHTCEGTGLYVGLSERDGFSVVCYKCKGKGQLNVVTEWDDFTGRVVKSDVVTVLEINPGVVVGLKGKGDWKLTHQSFGGMSYEDWYKGQSFPECSENRSFTCPAWWYQNVKYKKKLGWRECCGVISFSSCDNFETKAACWARFDTEQARANK